MNLDELKAELASVKELVVKVKGELLTKLGTLEQQIAALQNVPPEIPVTISEIKALLGEMDAVTPDTV